MSIRKSNRITRIFDGSLDLFAVLAAVLLLVGAVGVLGDVASRFFFGRPIWWMIEVTEYVIVWMCFLLAAWVARRGKHVRMDLVVRRLKPGTQSLLNIITSGMSAIVFLVVAWYGTVVTWESFKSGYTDFTSLAPPLAPLQVIIPVGSFLLFIQLLRMTRGHWKIWRRARTEEASWHRADEAL